MLSTGVRAADDVEITLVAEVREEAPVVPGGRPVVRFVPATRLKQGQEVFYTVRIRNPAALPVNEVEVVQKIPGNTVYVARSATGPGAEISLSADGGQTFGTEGEMTIIDRSALALMQATTTDPQSLTRLAKAQDYTHIRWRLRHALEPGAVALARFRAVFN